MGQDVVKSLERVVRRTQAAERIPALSVAVHRADRPLWTCQVGTSGNQEAPLDAATMFRIGSVTKTFTAVLVLQCRDDGLLDLDDPLATHLPVLAHGELTIRRLLAHTAGLQREPHGDVWDTLKPPGVSALLADLDKAERVLPTGRRFHYSNLGFALLGELVARLRRQPWSRALRERVLDPLGLAGIATQPDDRAAVGYLVDAYSDHARPEPATDFSAIGPAAQLWGTAADLARWAGFLADPVTVDPAGAVLKSSTVEEMRWPQTVTDDALWAAGFGLGLIVLPAGERIIHVGHTGAMPGFLAGAFGRRGGEGTPKACGVAVLGSSGTASASTELPHELLRLVVEQDPADVEEWRPAGPVPAAYQMMLGLWWGEGFGYVFGWHDGGLQARGVDDPAGRPPAVFEATTDPDVWRTRSGREAGELLRLTRDPATGAVVRLHWATYRFTRAQETFDGFSPSADES